MHTGKNSLNISKGN